MKNQTAKFTCATDATLTVSVFKGKKNIRVMARQRTPDEKAKTGCKTYFELSEEDAAAKQFDLLVKDAIAQGWTLSQRGERAAGFTTIPAAPKPVSRPGVPPVKK